MNGRRNVERKNEKERIKNGDINETEKISIKKTDNERRVKETENEENTDQNLDSVFENFKVRNFSNPILINGPIS